MITVKVSKKTIPSPTKDPIGRYAIFKPKSREVYKNRTKIWISPNYTLFEQGECITINKELNLVFLDHCVNGDIVFLHNTFNDGAWFLGDTRWYKLRNCSLPEGFVWAK